MATLERIDLFPIFTVLSLVNNLSAHVSGSWVYFLTLGQHSHSISHWMLDHSDVHAIRQSLCSWPTCLVFPFLFRIDHQFLHLLPVSQHSYRYFKVRLEKHWLYFHQLKSLQAGVKSWLSGTFRPTFSSFYNVFIGYPSQTEEEEKWREKANNRDQWKEITKVAVLRSDQ